MRLAVRRDPFDHPDWIYELKLDGFRSFAVIEPGTCELVSRNAHVYKSFAGLAADLARLGIRAIIDGEIVCLDSDGRPHFDRLFYRRDAPYFYGFEIVSLDGRDLRALPLLSARRYFAESSRDRIHACSI